MWGYVWLASQLTALALAAGGESPIFVVCLPSVSGSRRHAFLSLTDHSLRTGADAQFPGTRQMKTAQSWCALSMLRFNRLKYDSAACVGMLPMTYR